MGGEAACLSARHPVKEVVVDHHGHVEVQARCFHEVLEADCGAAIANKDDHLFARFFHSESDACAKSRRTAVQAVDGVGIEAFVDDSVAANVGDHDHIQWVEAQFLEGPGRVFGYQVVAAALAERKGVSFQKGNVHAVTSFIISSGLIILPRLPTKATLAGVFSPKRSFPN